jgi:hypothetical protein
MSKITPPYLAFCKTKSKRNGQLTTYWVRGFRTTMSRSCFLTSGAPKTSLTTRVLSVHCDTSQLVASATEMATTGGHGIAAFGHAEIAALAYEHWQARGCPHGSAE